MLVWTSFAAVLAVVAAAAGRQNIWAQATVFALLVLTIGFALYSLLFIMARITSKLFSRGLERVGAGEKIKPTSPFAEHRPPPQFVHPEEPVG
jgi:hypothetical protein